MAPLKEKGDLAELKVACDLMDRGWGIAVPWGENCDFDLIAYRDDDLQRVQVKYSRARDDVLPVKCTSHSLTNGRVRHTKRYTAAMIDWIAVYEPSADRCYYVPASELGEGRCIMHLRLRPARNNQRRLIRYADAYLDFEPRTSAQRLVE
jgi:PD-(D/E)XK endonuclease